MVYYLFDKESVHLPSFNDVKLTLLTHLLLVLYLFLFLYCWCSLIMYIFWCCMRSRMSCMRCTSVGSSVVMRCEEGR